MELIIRGRYAIFFTSEMNLKIIKDAVIIIEGNKIVAIGPYNKLKGDISAHDQIGDNDQLLLPGLVNTHTHLAMTLFRGIADDLPLNIWLKEHIWPLEHKLNSDDVYIGAKLGAIESLLAGTTTVNSMYWFPEHEALALKDTGLRGTISAPVISGVSDLKSAYSIISKHNNTVHGRIRASLALHAPYTVTISEFKTATDYVIQRNEQCSEQDKIMIHTHLAEPSDEIAQAKKFNEEKGEKFPDVKTSVELLQHIGALNQYLLAAHCIHVNNNDVAILRENKVRIAINPLSNAKLGNRLPPFNLLTNNIAEIGLGTDGPASNNTLSIFDTVRFMALAYKGLLVDPTVANAGKLFQLSTIGGAMAMNWKGIGTLEKDSLADIIAIDLKKPHLIPITSDEALISHFAYAMRSSDVKNVIVDGNVIIKNYHFEQINEEKVMEQLEQAVTSLIERNNQT